MLVIRDQQWKVFRTLPSRVFEDRLVAHFFEHYAYECEGVGEPAVRTWVRLGQARARLHGHESEREIAMYLGLMMILGCDFDRDAQYPWAAQRLNEQDDDDSWTRIQSLHAATMSFLDDTVGEDGRFIAKALVRMQSCDLEALCSNAEANPDVDRATYLAEVLRLLDRHKCDALGEDVTSAVIQAGMQRAVSHGIDDLVGVSVFVICSFMLGCGFDVDPMQSWAGEALLTRGPEDSGRVKSTRLLAAGRAHLEWSLANE